jgi:hypothetical protein
MAVFADADNKLLHFWQKHNHLLKGLLLVLIIVADWYMIKILLGGHFCCYNGGEHGHKRDCHTIVINMMTTATVTRIGASS